MIPDTPLGPLNENFKFFIAHLDFKTQNEDIRLHFAVSGGLRGSFRFFFRELLVFYLYIFRPLKSQLFLFYLSNLEMSISLSSFLINPANQKDTDSCT